MTTHFTQMAPLLRDRSKPAINMMTGQAMSHGVKKLNPPRNRAIPAINANASIPIKASIRMTSNE
jgi:hypothetical protein